MTKEKKTSSLYTYIYCTPKRVEHLAKHEKRNLDLVLIRILLFCLNQIIIKSSSLFTLKHKCSYKEKEVHPSAAPDWGLFTFRFHRKRWMTKKAKNCNNKSG